MIKTNDTTSWQEEAGDSILAGLRNKGREKALVIPEVAVAKPMKPMKEQGEKLFGVKRGVSKVLANNADVPFVDRINNYQDYPMPEKNEDGSISTHLLSAELDEEGIAWVFPNKVLNKKNNTYTTYRDNYEALAAAKADGNAVRFNTLQEANLFSQSYKNEDFEKYYSPSEEERGKTFEGAGGNIIDTAKQAYKGVLNVIEESPIPLFGKDSLGTDTLGKVADAIPLVKSALSPEDSVEKRKEEIKKLSVDIEERTPDNLSLTQQGFRAALESAPLTAVAMVTSIFGTPAAGLSIMGGYTGALEYNEAREKGKAYGASLAYGTVQGGIEAFTERLGLGPLMKMFKDKGNGFMTNAIAYGTRELIGENAAEFGQSMTAWYAGLDEALMNPDLSKTEKLILQAQRQYVASVAALSMSGTTTTASATINNLDSQVQTNNEPSIAEGWVKSKATYTRKDKDGNEIEKETGGIKYTRTVYENGEPVLPEKIVRKKKIKDNVNKKAPANKEGMYSKLEEALLNMKLETNNPQDVMGYFKNNSVVWDEMRDSGMLTFLQESIKKGKPVTRTELMKEFKDNSLMESYRRETLTASSEKGISVFDLLPESDIITINEYGLDDEATRTRANGRVLNEQEVEDRIAGSSYDMYSEIVLDPIKTMRVDEDGIQFETNNDRVRSPETDIENLSSNYSKEEISDLIISAAQKANQGLLTNPTTVSDVVTTEEEGKKALNNLIVVAKEQGYITYAEIVEILPADYLTTEQLEGIIKVLGELDIVVPDKKDIPKADLPLLRKNKLAQIEYIEKYLPEDLKNDLDTATKEQARKFLEENPEYVWDVETEEFAYNVVGYDGSYTLTITGKSFGSQPAKTMLTEEYSTLNEVQVQMKRYDQSNSIDPVVSDMDAVYEKQTYNSPNLDRKTYKETIIVMNSPDGGVLTGGYPYNHYSKINNTVLHLRTSERIDERGEKVLYIEEMQSDWLEAGERVITDESSPDYGMPEFGWRDSEKFKKVLTQAPENSTRDLEITKESIADIKKSLKKSFPSEEAFNNFVSKFADGSKTNKQVETTLKSIYFDEEVSLQDLANITGVGVSVGNNRSKSYALNGLWLVVQNADAELYNSSNFYADVSLYNPDEPNTHGQLKKLMMGKEQRLKLKEASEKQEKDRIKLEKQLKTVPKMPMKDKWHEFGMRVAVNMAIEGGFDRIAWSNSDEQVRRWGEGRTKSARYNESAGRVIITPVPEGVNKKMFISLYDKKLPSYANRLANQYNSKSGKVAINFLNEEGDYGGSYDTDSLGLPASIKKLNDKSSYLDISPEMVEAFKTGRVKFYRRGGLVSQEELKNAGRKITQGLRNKSWAEYLLALEQQKKSNVSPGWQGYRRKYATGGKVVSPLQGLKQSILDEIDGMVFNWKGGLAKKSIIKFVNTSFDELGDNPTEEAVQNLWASQSEGLNKLDSILKNPDDEDDILKRINNTYNQAYRSQFDYEIPSTDNTKLAEAAAIAAGGGTLSEWFNKGKNVRVPGENTASWKTLLKDSAKQLTKSDAAFKTGEKGLSTLRPLKAFTPSMLATGPDPLTRQLVGRTGNLLSKAASAVPRWLSAPLQILNPTKLGDGMLPEEGTPEYIQQMKTSDDMWKNYNNSLLESRQVKSNKANRSDKRDKREGVRQANEVAMQNKERAAQQAATKASNAAKKQAEEHAKAQKQKAQEQVYKQTKVDNKGNTGYTGQGNQSRAGNRKSTPAPQPVRRGKNYGVTGKRVTGGR